VVEQGCAVVFYCIKLPVEQVVWEQNKVSDSVQLKFNMKRPFEQKGEVLIAGGVLICFWWK
jgi:hypothetical protein